MASHRVCFLRWTCRELVVQLNEASISRSCFEGIGHERGAGSVKTLSRDSRAAQRIEVPDHVGDSCFGCPSVGQPAETCLAFAVRPGSDLGNRFAGKFVGAFVEVVTGMTTHPMPMHRVATDRSVESLPQIGILDRLPGGGPPAVAFPAVDPIGDSLAQIFAVGMEIDIARALES